MGVADFAATCACYGDGGEEAGTVLFETGCSFHQAVAWLGSELVQFCDEVLVDACSAFLRLLALWSDALNEGTLAFSQRERLVAEVPFLRTEVWRYGYGL